MSTIRKIIERVDENRPNSFSTASKVAWLAELDGKISSDVFLMDVSELRQFSYDPETDMDTELLVRFPHDDIYYYWLTAKIDAENGEYDKYQNTMQLYNASYNNFVSWFLDIYEPGQTCNGQFMRRRNVPSYYITAYGLAVKRGFVGTIDEWLASLIGKSAYDYAKSGGYPGTEADFALKMAETPVCCFAVSTEEAGGYMADMAFADVLQKHNAGFVVLCKITVEGEVYYLPINWVGAEALSFAGPVGNDHVCVEYASSGDITVTVKPLATQDDLAQGLQSVRQSLEESAAGTQEEVKTLQAKVAQIRVDLDYKPIDITAISCPQAGVHELGEVVETVYISWTLNKEPATQALDGEALSVAARSKELTGLSISSAKTYTLGVTDERGATDSASVSLSFYNGVYYGVAEVGTAIDDMLGLNRKLQSSKALTFTADAGATQLIAYALPARYGTPAFTVGGFEGGFSKAGTFEFTNVSGYTESYDLWLSDNVNLGSTTVKVS